MLIVKSFSLLKKLPLPFLLCNPSHGSPLTNSLIYFYHVDHMLKLRSLQGMSTFYQPAMYLYIDKILKTEVKYFTEKSFCYVLNEATKVFIRGTEGGRDGFRTAKTKTKENEINGMGKDNRLQGKICQLFQYVARDENLNQIRYFKSISLILVQAHYTNYKNKQVILKIANHGFNLLSQKKVTHLSILSKSPSPSLSSPSPFISPTPSSQQDQNEFSSYSYSIMRFIITLQKYPSLKQFSQAQYKNICIQKIKPLFLTFILELFWRNGLESQYKGFVDQLVRYLEKNQELIPFADVHHMFQAKKVIRDPRFFQVVMRLEKKMNRKVQYGSNDGNAVDKNQILKQPNLKLNKSESRYQTQAQRQTQGQNQGQIKASNKQQTKTRQQIAQNLSKTVKPQVVQLLLQNYINDIRIKYL